MNGIHNGIHNGNGFIVEVRSGDSIQLRRKVLNAKNIVDQELGFFVAGDSNNHHYDDGKDEQQQQQAQNDDASLGGMTVYLYIQDKRIVGFCSAEVITQAYRLLSDEMEPQSQPQSQSQSQPESQPLPKKRKQTERSMETNAEMGADANTDNTFAKTTHPQRETYARSTKPTKAIMGVHQLWCHHSHRKKTIAKKLVDAARSKLVYGMVVPHRMVAFSSPTSDGALFARRYAEPDAPLVYECH